MTVRIGTRRLLIQRNTSSHRLDYFRGRGTEGLHILWLGPLFLMTATKRS